MDVALRARGAASSDFRSFGNCVKANSMCIDEPQWSGAGRRGSDPAAFSTGSNGRIASATGIGRAGMDTSVKLETELAA